MGAVGVGDLELAVEPVLQTAVVDGQRPVLVESDGAVFEVGLRILGDLCVSGIGSDEVVLRRVLVEQARFGPDGELGEHRRALQQFVGAVGMDEGHLGAVLVGVCQLVEGDRRDHIVEAYRLGGGGRLAASAECDDG